MKRRIRLTENDLHKVIKESVKRIMNEDMVDAESLCYGREDLMRVSEAIANELGDIDIAEDLCNEMATTAVNFVKHLQKGGTYSVIPY